ncbi:enamelin [Spea bombifrons]|uniref:enamelin n=1 Tax=Spea bombifrons TaxID=233779 RepID=UPI00234A94CE|nr:enamelin [Spea bombifrons]
MPMHLGHTGSNSEEMPHVGSMYGLGFPHYSQMVPLHQASAWQPFSWLPQNAAKFQQMPHQVPQLQKRNPHQHQPQFTGPQSQFKHQHVTKQPQQALQLPPAPSPQIPQMFPPFPGEISPYQQYWPQLNNYLEYFRMGGRPPYNSEEINEDEEAPEKESPKAESTVTETSNSTTADTNSTTVDSSQGNNTTPNVSLPVDSQNVRLNGQNVSPDTVPVSPFNHGKNINTLAHASKPFQQTVLGNTQHKYYVIDKAGSGDHHNHIHLLTHLINKGSFTSSPNSGNLGYIRESQHFDPDKHSGRATIPKGSHNDGPRGTSQNIVRLPRYESVQPHTGNNKVQNLGNFRRKHEERQTGEHSHWPIKNNKIPKPKMIILDPQRNEYLAEYNRQLNVQGQQTMPRGLLTNHQNIQFQTQNESNQKNRLNVVGQNSKALLISDTPFIQSENPPQQLPDENFYEKDVRVFLRDSPWMNKQGSPQITKVPSGQQQRTIYIVSPFASNNTPVHPDDRQRTEGILNHAVEEENEQNNQQPNPLHHRNGMYPENKIHGQSSTVPYSGKQPWVNHLEFSAVEPNLHDPMESHLTHANQIRQELYNNDRMTENQSKYVLLSNPEPSMHTERIYFPGNQPLHQIIDGPIHKIIDSLDHNGYFAGYNVDSQTQNKKSPNSTNIQSEPIETVYYIIRHEPHLGQVDPVNLQLSPFTEKHSGVYNPDNSAATHKDNANYDMYPSGMRGQSPYQREPGIGHTGSTHYTCYLPVIENDSTSGLPGQLYVCCKHTHAEQGTIGKLENSNFRLTLQEYNEWLPYQDRTHRQHTRNVIDSSLTPACNNSNNENILSSGGERSEAISCVTNGCDEQKSEHSYRSFGVVDKRPCSARGDADNYLPLFQDTSTSPRKNDIAFEKVELPQINIQAEGTTTENDARLKKATGKLLSILTCPKNRQKIPQANTVPSKPNAFYLKRDIPAGEPSTVAGVVTHDEYSMVHQPSENNIDPVSNVADCLILNK